MLEKIKRVLVTGSSGMIGTRLCEKLLENNFEVTGVDIVPNEWNPKIQEKTILADLRKEKELEKLPKTIDFVVHLAAHPKVFASVIDPQLAFDNVFMALNCLEYCRKNSIKRFLFASSREVYGNTVNPVQKEGDVRLEHAESPYAASKMTAEAFIHAYQKCYGIEFEILRFSNVYGCYDNSERLIPQIIRNNHNNLETLVFGEKKALSFTFIDDAVEGILLGINNFEKAKNRVFTIAFPKVTKILDVARLIQDKMKSHNKIIIQDSRSGEVTHFSPDISQARKFIGFNPKIGLEEGLDKTIEWYENNIYSK